MKTLTYIIIGILLGSSLLNAQNQIAIPDTISGTQFDLTLQNGAIQFFQGESTNTMGVNGNILGPTLFMRKGNFVNINVNNNLDETTTIHWHGMHVSASNDGGPHTTIAPSETWNPQFTVMDRAGTYWYHPHLHEKTNKHVSMGIAGFIIVRDEDEAILDLPRTYGVDDFPLVIQTKDFDGDKQIITPSNADDVLMVNATIDPYLNVPAQVIRFRLLNGSSQRVFKIGLTGNQTFFQIGSDGGLLSEPIAQTRLQLAPGERAEILIDFDGMEGQTVQLMSYASEIPSGIYGATYPGMMPMMNLDNYNPNALNGNNFDIITFNVGTPNGNPVTTIPTTLVEVDPIPESSANITRTLFFTPSMMGPDQLNHHFLINGVSFNMEVINYSIPLDNTEIWSITNQSAIAHPFHIHDMQFYVLDRNGIDPPASEQGRKDVILIKPMETVRFITQFTDFANDDVPYMYHCHMLTHEDDGMMGQFEVVDDIFGINPNGSSINELYIYPNPAIENLIIIKLDSEKDIIKSVELFDSKGSLFIREEFLSGTNLVTINLNGMNKGTYILRIKTQDDVEYAKIIKW